MPGPTRDHSAPILPPPAAALSLGGAPLLRRCRLLPTPPRRRGTAPTHDFLPIRDDGSPEPRFSRRSSDTLTDPFSEAGGTPIYLRPVKKKKKQPENITAECNNLVERAFPRSNPLPVLENVAYLHTGMVGKKDEW